MIRLHTSQITGLKPFCRGISLVNTSKVPDPDPGVLFKPDLSIYANKDIPRPDEYITQAKLMIGFGELKNDIIRTIPSGIPTLFH